jgi:protein O-mannosyl-transferase
VNSLRTGSAAIRKRYPWGLAAGIVLVATVAAVAPSLDGEFLNWDDDRFVVNDPAVQTLSMENIAQFFSGPRFESYAPIHFMSYMIDAELWRGEARGYRVHNAALYLGAVVLLLFWMKRLGLTPLPAVVGCLIFAVAPYRVESVAWIAARKDALMLCFALGAWHCHLSAEERNGNAWRRALALMLFVFALLSKPSVLVLPVMMAIVDIALFRRPIKKAFITLAPFILLSLVVAAALPMIWQQAQLVREPVAEGVWRRLILVGWTLGHYLETIIWPFYLSPLYSVPGPATLSRGAALGSSALVALAVVLYIARANKISIKKPLVVIALFLSAMIPFVNIVPMYFLVADRYLLLPSIALALGAGYSCSATPGPTGKGAITVPGTRPVVAAMLVVVVMAYGTGAFFEGRFWRTSLDLWQHAVSREPESYYAWLKLGETLRDAGRSAESADAYRSALRVKPLSPIAFGGLFWAELLTDTANGQDLSRDNAKKLAFQFVAIANDREKLILLAKYLKSRGWKRATDVVLERFEPAVRSTPPQ